MTVPIFYLEETMIHVILYSTNCPKCKVLEDKLNEKKIPFDIVTDIDKMVELGIMTAPVLSVNGRLLQFMEAINWVNAL